MNVPTLDELRQLLDQLETRVADDLESDVLDFKPWLPDPKENLRTAVEYASCLANHLGGLIVFGVRDRVRGRAAAITGCSRYDLDVFRRGIYQDTRPNLTVEVDEVVVPEGTLLVVRVPRRPSDVPIATSSGLYKMRVGKNCMALEPHEWDRRRAAAGSLDWSALPMPGVSPADLDPVEIARMRRTLETSRPGTDLLTLPEPDLLTALGVIRDGAVTRAGFLVVGKQERLAALLPQHEAIYLHFSSELDFDHRLDLKAPLLAALERLSETIEARNPIKILKTGLFHTNIPSYPEPVYREAIMNALIHRNYLELGSVYLRQYHNRMEVSNPGGLVEGISPENFLHAEPRSRNRLLAEIFQKLGLVERAGIGRLRLFLPTLQYGKRPPTVESDEHNFRLTLHDGSFDEPLAAFILNAQREGTHFDIDDLLILTHLRTHGEIDVPDAVRLLQRPEDTVREKLNRLSVATAPWIEKRGKKRGVTYHLTPHAARALQGPAAYTRILGIGELRWPELVRSYVEQHGSITNAECRELLGLGNSKTARNVASRLLARLDFLRRSGTSKGARYSQRRPEP